MAPALLMGVALVAARPTRQWALEAEGVPPNKGIASQRHTGVTRPPLPFAAGRVVADSFWSQALGIRKQLVVWLPPSYAMAPSQRYPVAYYLHGVWGDETDWTRHGHLAQTLDSLVAAGMPEMIVVMPDGDDGWYTTWNWLGDWAGCRRDPPRRNEPADRYCVPWPHYDDYIARDLVSYIDRGYRTRADRAHRGIAGLSMGGYGAISLALAYPDVFSAAASHSGVVAPLLGASPQGADTARYARDIADLRGRYSEALWSTLMPAFGKDIPAWTARDPLHLVQQLVMRGLSYLPLLYLDCGADDPFVTQSRYFARAARANGISTTYIESPGAHDWPYWRVHLTQSATWLATRIGTP